MRPAVHLPLPPHLEGLVIHEEDAAGSLALGIAESRDIDALGPAMDGVRTAIAGTFGKVGRLDYLDDRGLAFVGLGVEDMDAR